MKPSFGGDQRFTYSGNMESKIAVGALSALAHQGRLDVFRMLVKAGPGGLAAGDVARAADILPNTLSASLNVLSHAGLVSSRREGRSIIYVADYEQMRDLLAFLMEDCCGGEAAICAPLADITTRTTCCEPA
jgi:DNA-binding transcriptional ArsR family regulator